MGGTLEAPEEEKARGVDSRSPTQYRGYHTHRQGKMTKLPTVERILRWVVFFAGGYVFLHVAARLIIL